MTKITSRHLFLLLFLTAFFLSVGGFVLEYGFGAKPCQMCWWQRYGHYAMLAFALLGWVACTPRKCWGFVLIGLSALVGLFVAVWQVLAQHKIISPPGGCSGEKEFMFSEGENLLASLQAPVASSCSDVGFTILGGSLATWNIFAMLFALALCVWGVRLPSVCGRFKL